MTNISMLVGCALCVIILAPADAAAQYCIGYTEYRIRRPDGKYLTKKRLQNLRFERIDGKARKIKFDKGKARTSTTRTSSTRFLFELARSA